MATATVRGTPEVILRIRANMLRRTDACIASQRQHFQHLLQKDSGILNSSYFCSNKQCKIIVARSVKIKRRSP